MCLLCAAGSHREQIQVCAGSRFVGTQAGSRRDPVAARGADKAGGHESFG